ncbi:MAG: histidine kinase [Hyphomicrobiales bacterium]|nr:histidine kinase [Hyphomicrobiales bacterium]
MNLEDLYRLLRSGHVQAQGIVDTLETPLVVLDASLAVVSANRAFFSTFEVGRDETIGRPLLALGDGQWDLPDLRKLLLDVIPKAAAVIGYEVTHDFPRLGIRTMLVSARRLVHPDDLSTTMLLNFDDVTAARHASADADILLAETRHRMKNLLATMRAIASQTRTAGRSADEYKETFLGRFQAVVEAQDLALSGKPVTNLENLIRTATDMLKERVVIPPGPSVTLNHTQVPPVGLILHEMATNAMKHGALSSPVGVVRIHWDVADEQDSRMLRLIWREENGPPCKIDGAQGFGSRLIQFSAHDLGAAVELEFPQTGCRMQLTFPIN